MKKLIALTLFLVFAASTQADTIERMWKSLYTAVSTGLGGEVNGDGSGWWAEVYNVTDDASTGGNTTATAFGWFTGTGYTINDFVFGSATETDSVLLRLYNNANAGLAGFYIDSAAQSLADLEDLEVPGVNDLDVTFDFTGSTWQAVPEPATALLFGIGGLGAFIVRRNKQKAQDEADA